MFKFYGWRPITWTFEHPSFDSIVLTEKGATPQGFGYRLDMRVDSRNDSSISFDAGSPREAQKMAEDEIRNFLHVVEGRESPTLLFSRPRRPK